MIKKDIVLVNIYNRLEDKKFLPEKLPLITPFVEKTKENIIHTALYSFHRPFEALQADIAYISFLQDWLLTQNFVFYLLICLLQKFIHSQRKKEIF